MMIGSSRRRILVIAPDPAAADIEAVVRRAAQDASEVVLVSLGAAPTPAQVVLARRALALGAEHKISVEVRLAYTLEDSRSLAQNAREVTFAAGAADLKSLKAAFLPKHPSLLGVADWNGNGRHKVQGPLAGTESVEALSGSPRPYPPAGTYWTPDRARDQKSAVLRIYLGSAPGVGKTFAMLGEAQRRRSRGTDVVVGVVETYGRPMTTEMITGLEVVPRRRVSYRDTWFDEMNPRAIIDRAPAVVLVDELAHTNVPGSRRSKRWEDVLEILSHGIEVITTLNIQHVESLNDVIARITGIRQQETVPDWMVDLADQLELVDMSPEALQRRMAHGNVYPDPDKAELALRRYFNLANLTALRELALMRVANRVDSELLDRWQQGPPLDTRERILVCLLEADLAEELIRRGARMAHHQRAEWMVLYLRTDPDRVDEEYLQRLAPLVRDLGGVLHMEEAESVVSGVLSFGARHHVTQCVVGEPVHSRWKELVRESTVNRLIRESSGMDIHVIARRALK